jgi:hypothetical protein
VGVLLGMGVRLAVRVAGSAKVLLAAGVWVMVPVEVIVGD